MKLQVQPRWFIAVCVGTLVCAGLLQAQDKPDRPPWAQPGQVSRPKPPTPPTPTDSPAEPEIVMPPDLPLDQPPPSATQSPAQGQMGQTGQTPPGTIKVNVTLVNVLVSVVDSDHRPVPDLPASAFQILEEGVAQKITFFESETKWPLDIALMIDASMSAHIDAKFESAAAAHFIQQVLRPGDRMSIFTFDENVTQRTTFTDKVPTLQDAVSKVPDGAGTSIYDALVLGSQTLGARAGDRRRVIILVTDGGETTSHSDFDTARRAALRAGALLYTVLARPFQSENERNTAGEHALQTITQSTGGAMFYPLGVQDLASIYDQINAELRTQYRLGYYPNPRGPSNTYRTIEVRVPAGYTARSRSTYFVQ